MCTSGVPGSKIPYYYPKGKGAVRWGAKYKDSESEAPTKNDPSSSSSTINTDSRSHGGTSSSSGSDGATDYLIRASRVSAVKSHFVVVITGGIRLMSAPAGKRKICAKTQNGPLVRHTAASAAGDRRVHFKISFQKLRRGLTFNAKSNPEVCKERL